MMYTKSIAVALAMLISPALADVPPTPQRYVHPFKGRLIVNWVKYGKAFDKCRERADAIFGKGVYEGGRTTDPKTYGRPRLGCALAYADLCEIIVTRDKKVPYWRTVYVHEVAHCNGWPADHPQ